MLACPSLALLHVGIGKLCALLIAGYRNDLGTGQDMCGLSTDPYDLHPELYSRSAHCHATGDSSARLEDPRQQPQGFMGWQQPPAAHLYPSAGKLRPGYQESLLLGKSSDVHDTPVWAIILFCGLMLELHGIGLQGMHTKSHLCTLKHDWCCVMQVERGLPQSCRQVGITQRCWQRITGIS